MLDNLLIAILSAAIALWLKEYADNVKSRSRMRSLASMCVKHLRMIRHDLEEHLEVRNGAVRFNETNYCELVVGEFLYDLFTTNIDLFPNVKKIERTVNFFHHYKINMATVKARLDAHQGNIASLTEGTYNNLRGYLNEAIGELEEIAGT